MNNNAPMFKRIQKIGRYFNDKPVFLDVDDKGKLFFRPYKKHRRDIIELIFINGVPIITAYMFMDLRLKKYKEKNIFIGKYKNENITFIVSCEGLILAYIKEYKNTYNMYEETNNKVKETIFYKHQTNLDNIIYEYKEKYPKLFNIID